jgi:gamma-glutamyl hydrolase
MIGIIEMPSVLKKRRIPTNYMKWVKSVGIIPVSIPYNLPKEELLICLDQVQGIMWTGGAIENKKYTKNQYDTYTETLHLCYDAAKEYNHKGRHFPIWGTCQGFEFLVLFSTKKPCLINELPKHEVNTNLSITFSHSNSKIKEWFSESLREEMMKKDCATHHHTYGFDVVDMPTITIVSVENDFINCIEYKEYPFYGVQFHPERPFDLFSKKVSRQFALFLKSELST